MNSPGVPISTIHFETHSVDNSHCDGNYYGVKYPFPVTLWRVFADEECISQGALPFASGDEVIELSANECMPYYGDGSDHVIARSTEGMIVWFRPNSYHRIFSIDEISYVKNIYRFKAVQYIEAFDQIPQEAEIQLPSRLMVDKIRNILKRVFPQIEVSNQIKSAKAGTQLPPLLLADELRTILKQIFPNDFDLPLYRIPERKEDRRGETLFRQVWNTINSGEIYISETPENPIEFRIGMDTLEFGEAVWQGGKVKDDIAILFVEVPYFPVWIGGFGKALQSERFLFAED
jgi:hypothetical protein